jgi:site-specific recombinase XerD
MALAGISGVKATPKGLRHSFAVAALQGGVQINLVKKWLGHARLSTTEIYADAVGEEEQSIATRLWQTF